MITTGNKRSCPFVSGRIYSFGRKSEIPNNGMKPSSLIIKGNRTKNNKPTHSIWRTNIHMYLYCIIVLSKALASSTKITQFTPLKYANSGTLVYEWENLQTTPLKSYIIKAQSLLTRYCCYLYMTENPWSWFNQWHKGRRCKNVVGWQASHSYCSVRGTHHTAVHSKCLTN